MQSSIVHAVAIPADGIRAISVEVQTAPSTYCVLTENNWSLSAIVTPTS